MPNQTVLITGCSSGFGKLIAKTFHDKGWNVIATMRSPEKESDLANGDRMLVTKLDVTDTDSIQSAFDEGQAKFGFIDTVVNNAGYGGNGIFEQFSADEIGNMYATNVFGPMNVMRAALPGMRKSGGGTIVNVTSMAGHLGLPGNSVYASSKHAMVGLTEGMALEYAPLGIRMFNVAPGAYDTGFGDAVQKRVESGDQDLVSLSLGLREKLSAAVEASRASGGGPQDPQEVADHVYRCTTEGGPIHTPSGADAEGLMSGMGQNNRQAFLDQLSTMLVPSK